MKRYFQPIQLQTHEIPVEFEIKDYGDRDTSDGREWSESNCSLCTTVYATQCGSKFKAIFDAIDAEADEAVIAKAFTLFRQCVKWYPDLNALFGVNQDDK